MSDRYRKRPVEIDAVRVDGSDLHAVARWSGGQVRSQAKRSDPTDVTWWVDIPTLEGVMRANVGDWVIRGVEGEFYPVKARIFDATYEPVDGT